MSDNRNIEKTINNTNYNSLTACINYEYCKKYGYDFLYYKPYLNDKDSINLYNSRNPITKELRHAAWSKLLSTMLALQLEYDFVVYIDSDCIFKNFDQSLEEFIKPYFDKNIIFLNNKPYNKDKPCSGFYICKVCEDTKQFLCDWNNFDFKGKVNYCRFEQGALWYIYNDSKYNIGIIDSWMFEEKENQFLRHIGVFQDINRIPYFSSFITKKNINYEKNINEIKVVSFDTDIIITDKT